MGLPTAARTHQGRLIFHPEALTEAELCVYNPQAKAAPTLPQTKCLGNQLQRPLQREKDSHTGRETAGFSQCRSRGQVSSLPFLPLSPPTGYIRKHASGIPHSVSLSASDRPA